jgi:hypothetical protein
METRSPYNSAIKGKLDEIDELDLVKKYKMNSIQINTNPIEGL